MDTYVCCGALVPGALWSTESANTDGRTLIRSVIK